MSESYQSPAPKARRRRPGLPIAPRLWAKVEKTEGCWNWVGATAHGYGRIGVNGRTDGAHRVSWVLAYGSIPDGLYVLHRCDNRRCVRPDHLFLGTAKDNSQDMGSKGRAGFQRHPEIVRRHERHHMAKLTEEQVAEIRLLRQQGRTLKSLGEQFGVHLSQIHHIVTGKHWRG